ncbi:MAG: XRE family transcriptional regulator [Mycobacterium sp.]|uniref:XRE family transcriptional regulator n=1 Tax=Mycobacterium sp. TaxID=1785 RepID=UPI00260F3F6E|nr:XRE family transcriptional regulator [Mycobacterium sp.]MDI3315846.1 XRE family transcriptional regulator [Mycobacterium sp.]
MNEFDPQDGESQVIVSLAEAAMHMYNAAIDSLPFPEDKKFQKRAEVVLSGLRKLRAALTEAAGRSRSTPAVIVALSDVRRRYDDLMARAAAAPQSTLGQQLYAVRIRAKLSAPEVARGAGLRVDLPDALEAGETPTDEEAAKVKEVIAALGGVAGSEDFEHTPPPEEHLDGMDHSLPANGAGQPFDTAVY